MQNKLIKFDSFGERVGLTVKGEESYQTVPGSIVSLLIKSLVLTVFIVRFHHMITFYETRMVAYETYADLSIEPGSDPTEQGFGYAFRVSGEPVDKPNSFYRVYLEYNEYEKTE